MEKRNNFGSKLGIILAAAGSAVGLGNVWRFPTETGSHGGAAFILIYVVCVIVLGIPVMLSEFVIGRSTHANTIDAYRRLAPRSGWIVQGYLGVFAAFIILSYYSVVAGWTMKYLTTAVVGGVSRISDPASYYTAFTSNAWWPIIFTALVLLITHIIVVRGVQNGIERFSKLLMPLLFIIIAVLVVCSMMMPGAKEGLQFLLRPDFSKITADTLLSALGQAFFSLSLAMGCLCTYASYFRDDANLTRTAVSVVSIDTLVAIMCGFIIFPAVFSVQEITPDAGPGLVFITLPSVFQMAFDGAPILGYIFALLFYLLLIVAAITSTISLHETITAFLHERGLSRRAAAWIVTSSCLVLGIFCSLSFGPMKDFRPFFGLGFFDAFDFLSAKIIMPIGGIIISLFAGWRLDKKLVRHQITNGGKLKAPLFGLYRFIIRWVAPTLITLVLLNELGAFSHK
jgi:Na+-dependent transporters of the SNF family